MLACPFVLCIDSACLILVRAPLYSKGLKACTLFLHHLFVALPNLSGSQSPARFRYQRASWGILWPPAFEPQLGLIRSSPGLASCCRLRCYHLTLLSYYKCLSCNALHTSQNPWLPKEIGLVGQANRLGTDSRFGDRQQVVFQVQLIRVVV
jgi:hypothetical protein